MFSTFSTFLWGATPVFVTLMSFVLFVALGNDLTAARAFTSLSLFNIMRFPLNMLPASITRIIDLSVVNRRLDRFMNTPELEATTDESSSTPADERSSAYTPLSFEGHFTSNRPAATGEMGLEIVSGAFRWPDAKAAGTGQDDPPARGAAARGAAARGAGARAPPSEARVRETLSLSLSVRRGSLVGVSGPVGSGKSSLLQALIHEMPRMGGRVVVRGKVAYCAQEPWIQNATLCNNVLFGRPFDSARYEQVLHACALTADIEQLPGGDGCEIGERGINLSGGQKARVALARACYQEADIYLLDDVLSAVDAHVGVHLVQHCIKGLLRGRGATVLMATHQTHFLAECDLCVLLREMRVHQVAPPSEIDGLLIRSPSTSSSPDSPAPARPPPPATAAGAAAAGAAAAAAAPKQRRASAKPRATRAAHSQGRLIAGESRERGLVNATVWGTYVRALSISSLSLLLFLYTLSQSFQIGSSWWLAQWSANTFRSIAGDAPWFYVYVYAALSLSNAALIWLRVVVVALACLRASRRTHASALGAVFAVPQSFYDTTPLGRILNRFSTDLQVVDVQLRTTTQQLWLCAFNVVGVLALQLLNSLYILLVLPPIALIYARVASYYRHSSRELQRLDSVSKSPIYAAFTEALNGAATIRAFGAADRFTRANHRAFDHNIRAGFVSQAANRWLAVRLEALGNAIVALAAAFAVLGKQNVDASGGNSDVLAGLAGLALAYANTITDYLNWLIRVFTLMETQMVNCERLFEYAKLEPEEPPLPLGAPPMPTPPVDWPAHGAISFRLVTMAYREGLTPVLNGLSLEIGAREKVGIVGRTGAGKSSMLAALFRLAKLQSGSILIDGIDISTISRATLRQRLAIIPQDPVLFSGTLRENIDPFREHGEQELWQALEQCYLADTARAQPDGLSMLIESQGGNLSMGQRQLVCTARALLKRARVLVLDEATASVDLETDELIQVDEHP